MPKSKPFERTGWLRASMVCRERPATTHLVLDLGFGDISATMPTETFEHFKELADPSDELFFRGYTFPDTVYHITSFRRL